MSLISPHLAEAMKALSTRPPEDEAQYVDPDDPMVRADTGWAIQNVQTCEWAMMRLASIQAEKAHIFAAAVEAKRRIDAKAAYLSAKLDRGEQFFTGHIERYATANREPLLGGGKKKSRTLLYGTLGWRKRAGRLIVSDDLALKKWLTEQDDESLFRVKVEPEMAKIQEKFAVTGQIPPGMEFVTDTEKFYVDAVDPAAPLVKP